MQWTAGEWAFFIISAIGGITGYAVLIVYVASLKHNMPEQWQEIAKFQAETREKLDDMTERVHECEKKVTRECAVERAREQWKVREGKEA